MFIRKNNVIYNLNLYAKVYPNVETCALCLAHLDDDFDAVYFSSKEELLEAFDTITRYFNPPMGMTADQISEMLNLDVLGAYIQPEIERDLDYKVSRDTDSSDPLMEDLSRLNVGPIPITGERQEELDSLIQRQAIWNNATTNLEIDTRTREQDEITNARLSQLESEHNNIVEELRERNNILQDQIFTLRDTLNRLTEQRDNIEDDTGYDRVDRTWDL